MEYLFECSQQSLVALPAFGRAQLKSDKDHLTGDKVGELHFPPLGGLN